MAGDDGSSTVHGELRGTRVRRRQLQAAGGGGKAKPRRGSTGRQGTRPREEEMKGTRWCSTGAGHRSWPWRGRTAARGGNKCGERTSGSAGVRPWAQPKHGQGASRGVGVRPSTRRARPGRGDRKWARAKRGEEGRSSQGGCRARGSVLGEGRGGRRGRATEWKGTTRWRRPGGGAASSGDGGAVHMRWGRRVRGARLAVEAAGAVQAASWWGGACRRWA